MPANRRAFPFSLLRPVSRAAWRPGGVFTQTTDTYNFYKELSMLANHRAFFFSPLWAVGNATLCEHALGQTAEAGAERRAQHVEDAFKQDALAVGLVLPEGGADAEGHELHGPVERDGQAVALQEAAREHA